MKKIGLPCVGSQPANCDDDGARVQPTAFAAVHQPDDGYCQADGEGETAEGCMVSKSPGLR